MPVPPVPDHPLFRVRDEELTDGQRLVAMIEWRHRLLGNYSTAYGNIAAALTLVRDGSAPTLARLTEEQRREAEDALVASRDETARAYSQAITTLENAINELAPGSFPSDDAPFQSFDLGEWIEEGLELLSGLLGWLADGFEAIGLDMVADGLDWAADRVDDIRDAGEEAGLWGGQDDSDDEDDNN